MRNQSRNVYSAFTKAPRELSANKGSFSPTLRLKALAAVLFVCLAFWGTAIYIFAR